MREGGKLITVFSSAGLRDKEKRYTMGEVAGKIADIVIATIDDPRTEKVYDINNRIVEGAKQSGMTLKKRFATSDEYKSFIVKEVPKDEKNVVYSFDEQSLQNRYDAIDFAIKLAQEGDVVLLEGKGHEVSLAINKEEFPYSEHEAALKILSENLQKYELKMIKFSLENYEKIKRKNLKRTLRLKDDKEFVKNERVILAVRDGQGVEEVGEAIILQVAEKRISELTKKDLKSSDFETGSLEEFRKFYGDSVKKDSIVKLIDFKVIEFYE
ncbi:MAG: hypothetical protein KatS3mg085_202 [Candidatus Dojkabacteria bacterium]|nr:MAG: hypothetical protein KatS3mg085_202 [Candidatus Dojkabacteria bacterium]